jgi:hypothetical protein
MLPTKFRFIWPSSFRGEDLKKLANQKQELSVVAMFVSESDRPPQAILVSDWLISKKSSPLKRLGQMNRNLVGSILRRPSIKIPHLVPIIFIEDLPRMIPTKFRFTWPSSYRGEDCLEINQSETRIACGGHAC